ncbi:alpha-protein kinase 1 isoform 2-T3 [Mantella aurantiaca]
MFLLQRCQSHLRKKRMTTSGVEVFLKACIKVCDSASAAAIVFLIDRFLYWADASTRLLSVAKALHKLWPSTPIAPQVVIRQARISVNTGKLLKAEYILSSLISNNGATGTWLYSEASDRLLVQSVCIQIRGQILQKLGMWYEAAELIWTSIVGFFELPVPDKKGIATSLGVLADIFISMSEEDYQRFKKNNYVGLTLLEEFDHRLLSAAEACKLAATFSLYTPLFVLTNLNIRGACLLSYSLSNECPMEKKSYYLLEAKESFEIGLLTKKKGDQVTSKQELHSFVKSAFCLAKVHKWLDNEAGQNEIVNQFCKDAMENLAIYNMSSDKRDKGVLASDVMHLVTTVTELLKVQPFPNSDDKSFVPDSYRDCIKKNIVIGKVSFNKLLDMYSQHHISVCKVFDVACRNHITEEVGMKSGACITAMKTTDTISTVDSSPSQTASDKLHDQSVRRKLLHSDAVSYSFDEERRQRLSSSHSGSQGSNLSNSSFSWECIPEQNEKEPQVSNSEGDRVVNYSSSSISNNAEGEKKYGPDIHLQSLSLQDNVTQNKVMDNKTPGEYKSDQRICMETSAPNSLVSRKSSAKGSSTNSDEGSFEFVDLSDVAETNKPTSDTKNQVFKSDGLPAGQASGTIGLDIYFEIDSKGETQDTTDDVPSGIQNTMMVPPGSSGVMTEPNIYSDISSKGETQDTTDDVPSGIQNTVMGTPCSSGDLIRSWNNSGIGLRGVTEDSAHDPQLGIQNPLTVFPGSPGGIANSRIPSVIDQTAETQDTTNDLPHEIHSNMQIHTSHSGDKLRQPFFCEFDATGETKDTTDDTPFGIHEPVHEVLSDADARPIRLYETNLKGKTEGSKEVSDHVPGHSLIFGIDSKVETNITTDEVAIGMPDSDLLPLGQSTFTHKSSASSSEGKALATEDNLEMQFLSRQWSVESSADKTSLSQQSSLTSSEKSKAECSFAKQCQNKEDVDSRVNVSFSSSHGSSSWSKISQFSGSLSDSHSSLNSSISSFVVLQAQHNEQIRQARSLDVTDYEKLLSGVSHEWLLKRLEHTGLFTFKHVQKTYNALLLKFSKKSELWTAQETLVHFGKDPKKEGKQRKAFWISFLHQDETLGRYVGKAYKKHKELLYHFIDVERQMTAQYYVTEFNKRLYEQNIPTQIFYIPSSVLLIMDDRTITSCVSVEPYILGDFVKLTNNTKTVRMQYDATKYGLAFGHFVYEFSQFSDIVVDLQGWVTGNKEGEALIYLTDPQIHSVNDTSGTSCINFGYKGIYMFFSCQHTECNEICHRLSLSRPDIKELEKYSNTRTQRDRQDQFKKTKSM